MPRISVIVAIYKVELYLRECIDSILSQTFSDFELILVDDGSLDNCPVICDEYAKKDNRVIVIHKENGGVSSARNSGISIANGEYITFVDGDDCLLSDALYSFVDIMDKYGVDCARFSDISNKESFDKNKRYSYIVYDHSSDVDKISISSKLHSLSGNNVCECVFKNQIIKENNIYFLDNHVNVYEDMYFSMLYILFSNKTLVSNEPVYFYRQHPLSTTHTTLNQYFFEELNNYSKEIYNKLNNPFLRANHFYLHYSIIDQGLYSFGLPNTFLRAKTFVREIKKIKDKHFFYIYNKKYLKIYKFKKTSRYRFYLEKAQISYLKNGVSFLYLFKISIISIAYRLIV